MSDTSKYTDEELIELVDTDISAILKKRGYKHGWYKETEYVGYIYILVNPSLTNMVKIGYATDVKTRMKSLYSTNIPDPYHCYAWYKVRHKLEDKTIHHLIDSLDPDLRHSTNREFYDMKPERAYEILSAIAQISGNDDCLIFNPLNDDYFTKDISNKSIKSDISDSKKDCQDNKILPDGKYEYKEKKKRSENGKIIKASLMIKNSNWYILKGSVVGLIEDKGLSKKAREMRDKMIIDANGVVLQDSNLGKGSPSAVAGAIIWQSQNGWDEILDSNGNSINQYRI